MITIKQIGLYLLIVVLIIGGLAFILQGMRNLFKIWYDNTPNHGGR